MRAQICLIYRGDKISGRHRRRIFLAKQIADTPEYVAAIVKRHNLHRPRDRNSCLEIQHRKRIATHRHSKRIQKHDVLFAVSKSTFRNHDLTWSSLFKTKSTQCRRTAREETLADG